MSLADDDDSNVVTRECDGVSGRSRGGGETVFRISCSTVAGAGDRMLREVAVLNRVTVEETAQ